MNETFRLRKFVKYQGIAFTAVFLAATIAYSSIFFLEEPKKHGFKGEHSVAVVGGLGMAVFGAMLLMSLYTWAAYYVERFTIRGTSISIRSMLQNRQFDASEVQELQWKHTSVGGGIRFRVRGSTSRLDLHGYARPDRLRIVRVVRELVPSDIQIGWPHFCHKVALPLRDGKPPIARREPATKVVTVTRNRYDRMLAVALPLSLAVALAAAVALDLWQFLALPILAIAAWLLLRLSVPREGRAETRLTSTTQGRMQVLLLTGVVVSQLLMVALSLYGVDRATTCGAALVVLLAAAIPGLYLGFQSDKRRRAAERRAAHSAPKLWDRGERTRPVTCSGTKAGPRLGRSY